MRGSRVVSEDGEGMSPTTLNRLGTFINRVSLYCPPPVILRFFMSSLECHNRAATPTREPKSRASLCLNSPVSQAMEGREGNSMQFV
jgi:hypothetical protein